MRVLVCGGRTYADRKHVYDVLDDTHRPFDPIECVIHGGASGADKLAADWAHARGVRVEEYRANWNAYGPAAGPMRNGTMLEKGKPDVVIAFPGGSGTHDMVSRAQRAGVAVHCPSPAPQTPVDPHKP